MAITLINWLIFVLILPAGFASVGAALSSGRLDLDGAAVRQHPLRASIGGILGVLVYAAVMLSVPEGGYGDPMSKGLMRYAPAGTSVRQDAANIDSCRATEDFRQCMRGRGYNLPVEEKETE